MAPGINKYAELIPDKSNINLFVLCTTVPTEDDRKQIYFKYSTKYIENINILYESDAVWTTMREKLFDYHIARLLDDEDLGRVILRKEAMVYHQVLDNSIELKSSDCIELAKSMLKLTDRRATK